MSFTTFLARHGKPCERNNQNLANKHFSQRGIGSCLDFLKIESRSYFVSSNLCGIVSKVIPDSSFDQHWCAVQLLPDQWWYNHTTVQSIVCLPYFARYMIKPQGEGRGGGELRKSVDRRGTQMMMKSIHRLFYKFSHNITI